MSFARVDIVEKDTALRRNPVEGGRFGDDTTSGGHTGATHQGVDIFGSDRTVRAATDIEIIRREDATRAAAGTPRKEAGPIWIDAWELSDGKRTGFVERYLHLATAIDVSSGQVVKAGTVLGKFWDKTYKGNEGHLHFEVRSKDGSKKDYGKAYNPKEWFRSELPGQGETVKIVCQLGKQAEFKNLSVGDTVYAKSGHRIEVTRKSAYPFFYGRALDLGIPNGEVTADIGEAADWTLAQAEKDTEHSWTKDGILGLNAWAYRIRAYRDRIAEARKIKDPAARYAEAWEIRKQIAGVRNEGFVTSQAKSFKAAATQGAQAVKEEARDLAGSFWDAIPSEVKWAGGALAGVVALVAIRDITKD